MNVSQRNCFGSDLSNFIGIRYVVSYSSGGEKRRPEIGLRSQASYVTNIQENLGWECTSAYLNQPKKRFPSSHRS